MVKQNQSKMRFLFFVYLILYIQNLSFGQSKEEIANYKLLSQSAKKYAKEAKDELKKKNIDKAESLYLQSLSVYPVYPLLDEFGDLFEYKKKINDIKSINIIYDSIINAYKKFEKVIIDVEGGGVFFTTHNYKYNTTKDIIPFIFKTKVSYNIDYGNELMKMGDIKGANKLWKAVEHTGVGLDMIDLYLNMVNSNFQSGDIQIGLETALKYLELYRGKKPEGASASILMAASLVAFSLEDKKSLQQMNDISQSMKKSLGNSAKFGVAKTEILLNILNGEYQKAITELEDLKKGNGDFWGSKYIAKETLPLIYIITGDYIKAEAAISEHTKHLMVSEKQTSNLRGLVFLGKGNYSQAISEFTTYLGLKNIYIAPDKFKYYCKRAEAYEGLKEFDKAKKDYEAALVYKPDYEVAITGLARLEGRIISERKTDKAPPQITITEPALARGLIVKAAGNDVMIKGIAADPAGLKFVTINGEKVYSQEGGTFWGSVALKEGVNKVTVAATDFSGNTGEQVFDIERPATVLALNAPSAKEGKNYALLIGCQNYDDINIPSLQDPIPDAVKLKLILKNNYSFSDENLFTLFNPEVSDFRKKFLEIYEVIQPEDNLVIFYAGHGIWNEKEKKGYWMLTDAKLQNPNSWLSNKEVLDKIARVPARHTLLITDACFSGSVFKTRGLNTEIPIAMQQMNQKISRVAITSGNDTEVPDKSVFMKYLVKALSENKEKYLTAQKMFINQIIEAVMTETKTEPRYGTLELAGHVGGDFIFIKK